LLFENKLHILKPLLPYFIQERFEENKRIGHFDAYTMFVDISGFTAMTETLMKRGNEGAEILSGILNQIFEPLVTLVYQQKGFIPYFAGDAFTAIFPLENTSLETSSFLDLAFQIRNFFNTEKFPFNFNIKAKIGLSVGNVEWGIVGSHPNSFYFRGKAVNSAAYGQVQAKAKEVVLDIALLEKIQVENKQYYTFLRINDAFYLVESDNTTESGSVSEDIVPEINIKVAANFLPNAVINFNQSGEFRNVITFFIAFDGVANHENLDALATIILEQTMNFSGYFKEIDYSDKGGVMVVIFGAPLSYENNVQRAMEFALNVRQETQNLSNVKLKMGVSSGDAYTGIIGGKERCQYAAVGSQVNLAARLMTTAKWGDIFCDQELSRNRSFRFAYEGNIAYKGISKDIATYQLLGKKSEEEFSYQNVMIGREQELSLLINAAQPILEGHFAGITYVYGEAGIGKSRLTFELKKTFENKGVLNWLVCQSDQILRKPFNPFIYCLKNYFEQSTDKQLKDNKSNFDEHFEALLKKCLNSTHEKSDTIIKELIRTKSILSGLVGIVEQNSLWEQLDAKGRYENTLAALSNFFTAQAMLHPLIIALEDGHWYDDDSKRFLQEFIKNIINFPVFILVTSRYNDDNSKSNIFSDLQNIHINHIDLNILQPEALQKMAEVRFSGKVDDAFLAFLQRSSNGNPFYAEQVLEYFLESGLLEKTAENIWTVKDKSLKLGGSMNTVLTARVDRLSYLVRETVKAAAVIGREFDLPVLSEVMKTQEEFIIRNGNGHLLLQEQVQTAEKSQIWQAMNELRYIFKHSLLREAIYDMQLRARLRELHRAIAESIEKLYEENIEERFADLAFHYEQAEIKTKTTEYLNKAADFAKRNYQNSQAIEYYEKLLTYYPTNNDQKNVLKIVLKKGELLQLSGNWNAAEADFQKALELAENLNDNVSIARASGTLGNVLMLKGDYTNAKKYHETGLSTAISLDDAVGIGRSLGGLGNLYFRQGNYEMAESYFKQCLEKVRSVDERHINPQIVANLGLTYMNQSRYEEGIACMLEQLRICDDKKDKQGRAIMHTNLGIVYNEEGDYDAAQHHFQEGLAMSEELGNKFLISIALGSLGNVYEKKGDFKTAEELYIQDLQLTEQLGDKQGIAIALGLIGGLYSEKGEFEKALDYIKRNLALCEQLGYQKGIVKGLNLMGDVYSYSKQFELAISYYKRSMEAAEKIHSRLLYALSAIELANVYLEINEKEKAALLEKEVAEICEIAPNRQLLFEHSILKTNCLRIEKKTKEAEIMLQNLLLAPNISEEEEAIVFFELAMLEENNQNLRQKVTSIHIELYRKTPKYLYLKRLNMLGM
jgi:tetratricopeptide (TPR) repeat protein